MEQADVDAAMMRRCIHLSATARPKGDLPIACIICEGDKVIAEATNRVRQEGDVTRHAELIAISEAQHRLGRRNLADCTLYTTVEPCVMCSFPIRETRLRRVVYALSSPKMGGVSRWNVLRDPEISNAVPEVFGPIPEVISGLHVREAARVWRMWNPIVWAVIRARGCFGPEPPSQEVNRRPAVAPRNGWLRSLFLYHES
jgi:tRNA(adenine34) deaminase